MKLRIDADLSELPCLLKHIQDEIKFIQVTQEGKLKPIRIISDTNRVYQFAVSVRGNIYIKEIEK